MSVEAPERVYVWPENHKKSHVTGEWKGGLWSVSGGGGKVEYVRADKLEELAAENKALANALREHVAALTNLTAGGSEYFGKKIGEVYLADIPFCTQRIRQRMGYRVEELKAKAALAEKDKEIAALRELIRWAHDTLYEINPSNYDHDEVCKLNDASVEVILGIAPTLGETHGYTKEWWAARNARGNNGE